MPDIPDYSPLTEAVYYILLSLYEPAHGYGIMQNVGQLSGGRVSLGPGTLYGALGALVDKGWINGVGSSAGARKKDYIITDAGKLAVTFEIARLEELLRNGRDIVGRDEVS